jgi:hypothetical protein
MIISHEHRFIFLKTRKTAGTSVEIALSRSCGPRDVLTPISKEDEPLRAGEGVVARNYLAPPWDYRPRDVVRLLLGRKKLRYWNHVPGVHVRREVGERIWNSYYKFCFERNPWDKTVSMYFWDQQFPRWKGMPFSTYVKTQRRHYNFPIYTDGDRPIVDFVGKFETLEADLAHVCATVGLSVDGKLPRAKGGFRSDKRHYSTHYTDDDAEVIRAAFAKEIALVGYTFERQAA